MMRKLLSTVLAVATVFASSVDARAQGWPTHPVTLLVPFAAGSGTDLVARVVAASASETLGQQIIVENAGGAGGTIGVSRAARMAPDGYNMVIGAVDTFAQSQWLYAQPKYNPLKDFTPIGLAIEQPLLLTVNKNLPVNDIKEFVVYVKSNHAKMQFGSAGVGAAPHLACFTLNTAIGVEVTHVPYRGSAPALADLMAGTLDYYCPLAGGAIPLMSGKLIKALAVLTPERSELLPDLPTAKEQGVNATDGYYWIGFWFPAGTAQEIINKMNGAIRSALSKPEVKARLREQAATVVSEDRQSPEYLRKFNEEEISKWAKIIKASGIVPQ
jgi:tripartite-type tricarboxylate transporter receptor subunit TctC